jgi:hypothetical protein
MLAVAVLAPLQTWRIDAIEAETLPMNIQRIGIHHRGRAHNRAWLAAGAFPPCLGIGPDGVWAVSCPSESGGGIRRMRPNRLCRFERPGFRQENQISRGGAQYGGHKRRRARSAPFPAAGMGLGCLAFGHARRLTALFLRIGLCGQFDLAPGGAFVSFAPGFQWRIQ